MHPALGIGSPCSQPVRINKAGKASSTVQILTAMVYCNVLTVGGLTSACLTAIDCCSTLNTESQTLKAKGYKPFIRGSQLLYCEKKP